MCRHVCPVGRATRREATTPHGWGLLIASVERGQLSWDTEAVDTLYQCAQCSLCLANCVTDRPLPSAIAAARAEVFAAGLAPSAVGEVDSRLRRWGNPFGELPPAAPTNSTLAALVIGAAAYHLHPDTPSAARRLLDALGIEHSPIAAGLSSAYLPYALGLLESARALAQSSLHEITASHCTRLIVLTPEDAHAFLHVHPELGLPLPDGVEVVELITLLAEALDDGRLEFRASELSLTYHDPAYTPLFPERAAQARRVLSALTVHPVREMLWRQTRAAPGGTAGGLRFTHPALAATLTRDRLAEAAATGAEWLVTEDPAALADFETHAQGTGIRVKGLYQLAVETLND